MCGLNDDYKMLRKIYYIALIWLYSTESIHIVDSCEDMEGVIIIVDAPISDELCVVSFMIQASETGVTKMMSWMNTN
jgi:hypothetical protein